MKILRPEDVYPVVKVANYMALEGAGAQSWPRRRIPDFELILSMRGEFEFINHDIIYPIKYEGPIDQIYNFACPASPQKYQQDPVYTLKVNFQ